MTETNLDKRLQLGLGICLALNILFWFYIRDTQSTWTNVPPPPDEKYASSYGLGDASFAYRLNGIMLQNIGDTGGRVTSLQDYNYELLQDWFLLQDQLDEKSNFIPYLAARYFSFVQTAELYRPILDYLQIVGQRDYGEKWRWMVDAIDFSKRKLKDKDKALELAKLLAETKHPNTPAWVKRMPAYVLTSKGDKEAAYALMVQILKESGDKLHPNEIFETKRYICRRILGPAEALNDPICQDIR